MTSVMQDVRYGLRMLRKSPGVSLAAALTLALGIGANTTIFSVMNAVFFRPLPFRDANRLVMLTERGVKNRNWQRDPAMATIYDWEKRTRSFADIQLAVNNEETGNLTLGNETERLRIQFITTGLLDLLGLEPIIGHGFHTSDTTKAEANGVYSNILISRAMWQRHWGGDPGILGKTLRMFDANVTIAGVMPDRAWVYPWLRNIDVWMAVDPPSNSKEFHPELRWLGVLARLKPGISLEQATAEMAVLGQQLASAHPETNRDWTADALALQEAWFGDSKQAFYLLLGATGFVLLIACANVANLMLARAGARAREMAIRASIGGTRARIARQLLTESMVLALIGGVLGLVLSHSGVKLFVALLPDLGTLVDTITIDGRVMLFALAAVALTGILFGAAPAIRLSAFDLNRCLKEGGDRSGGSSRNLGGSLLVVGEVALTLILLAGAGLMVNSFVRLERVDLGFNPAHLLTANVELDTAKYKQFLEGDIQRVTPATDDFFSQAVERLKRTPGVVAAAVEGSPARSTVRIAGRSDTAQQPTVTYTEVDDGYLRTMQIPLLQGRALTAKDDELAPWVALINRAMAKRYFPGENPIGKQIYLTLPENGARKVVEPGPRTIVGVVSDAREFGPASQPQPWLYLPHRQHVRDYLGANAFAHLAKRLIIRTAGDPLAMSNVMRRVVGETDRTQVVNKIQSMEQIVGERVSPWRFLMEIFGILAGLALALAGVGIFGVMSYTVSRRTHEIGVRMALGAGSPDVLGLMMKHGLKLTVPGLVLGLGGAFGLTRLIGSMLYGVPPNDPLTLSAVSLLLLGIALAACYFPARRAMSVDPVKALRNE